MNNLGTPADGLFYGLLVPCTVKVENGKIIDIIPNDHTQAATIYNLIDSSTAERVALVMDGNAVNRPTEPTFLPTYQKFPTKPALYLDYESFVFAVDTHKSFPKSFIEWSIRRMRAHNLFFYMPGLTDTTKTPPEFYYHLVSNLALEDSVVFPRHGITPTEWVDNFSFITTFKPKIIPVRYVFNQLDWNRTNEQIHKAEEAARAFGVEGQTVLFAETGDPLSPTGLTNEMVTRGVIELAKDAPITPRQRIIDIYHAMTKVGKNTR